MPWNKPGDNGKDPWNNQSGNNQDPPDLDEVIKNFQNKFGRIFGKKGGKPSTNIGLLIAIAALVWAAFGIYIIEPAERGVILRFGKYSDTVGPGPHWMMPLVDTRYIINVDRIRSYTRSGVMLTQDENIVDIKLEVQYKVKDAKPYVLAIREPDLTLKQVTESALRQVVGKTNLHDILTTGRALAAEQAKEQLQILLDRYQTGLLVTQVNMLKSDPPTQVKEAFDDVIKAREDKERIISESEAYSNQILPLARGEAKRLIAEAEAYKSQVTQRSAGDAARFTKLLAEYEKAPEITQERLYLDSYESVLKNTSKIMLDVDGNNLMVLPLDKIIGGSSAAQTKQEVKDAAAIKLKEDTLKQINPNLTSNLKQAINKRYDLARSRQSRERGVQ